MKLTIEHCKKLYEITRDEDSPEWSKLYPQQKAALEGHYKKALQMIIDNPHLYKRSNISVAEDVISDVVKDISHESITSERNQ